MHILSSNQIGMKTTLVINPGSSTRKYALYASGRPTLEFSFESTDSGFEMCSQKMGTQQICEAVSQTSFEVAFAKVAKEVKRYLDEHKSTLDIIAVQIVAPGSQFQKHSIVDDVFISLLKSKEISVPLHIPAVVKEIEQAREHFKDAKIIAVSDSAFHTTLTPVAREYSLARADAEAYDIHRFGYNGLSVQSIVNRIHAIIGRDPARIVVCHIGDGVSVTAVKDGKSVETTMGFAPVSGLPMGSRAGDLDPSCLLELMRLRNMSSYDASLYVHKSGGLAGLGGDGDIRRLLDRRSHGDERAKFALEFFAYHIQKAVAAATVPLAGIDALVLTGTASLRSSELRTLVVSGLKHFGIDIEQDRNNLLVGKEGVISVQQSMVKVLVIRTDEMGEIARIAEQLHQEGGH
jgi:acetate kinase